MNSSSKMARFCNHSLHNNEWKNDIQFREIISSLVRAFKEYILS